ncbi:hypothetical protein JT05_11275 [Desulfosporosinus sp. Tol-M]|nr:hypothetical protein JT05_11275 [Desulfosporosinus sp. Tol-M]
MNNDESRVCIEQSPVILSGIVRLFLGGISLLSAALLRYGLHDELDFSEFWIEFMNLDASLFQLHAKK